MAAQTEDLIAFLAVAREGSFGRAASSLLVSQPAVSERMARLEREMGATLFVRGARGTTLTLAGEHLLPYATRTIDLLDEAAAAVGVSEGSPRLRVAVHVTFAHRVVPLVLNAVEPLRDQFLKALLAAVQPLQQGPDPEVALEALIEATGLLKERLERELEELRQEEAE